MIFNKKNQAIQTEFFNQKDIKIVIMIVLYMDEKGKWKIYVKDSNSRDTTSIYILKKFYILSKYISMKFQNRVKEEIEWKHEGIDVTETLILETYISQSYTYSSKSKLSNEGLQMSLHILNLIYKQLIINYQVNNNAIIHSILQG